MMKAQDTHFTLQCGDLALDLSAPVVMGILNVTPDSFFDGGKHNSMEAALAHARKMIADGASIIDIGAVSTRPGAVPPSEEEEWNRMAAIIPALKKEFPQVIFSVDTYRSSIARRAVQSGVHIVNDVSGGMLDEKMFETVAELNVPYVLMHLQGTPETMQRDPHYENVVEEVKKYFTERIEKLQRLGVKQIILDPGFGFGKTVEHNYQLLAALPSFLSLGYPILAGLSRKSMVTKFLGVGKHETLNGTTALNTIALQKGARILRVHDVKEAMECVRIFNYLGNVC